MPLPKSLAVDKAIDRAAGVEREVVGYDAARARPNRVGTVLGDTPYDRSDNGATITAPATEAAKQWEGWGTALKPAVEIIILARKPLRGTVAQTVQQFGVGALNIDACRVPTEAGFEEYVLRTARPNTAGMAHDGTVNNHPRSRTVNPSPLGRWPANVVTDGSEEVLEAFKAFGSSQDGIAVQRNGGGQTFGGKGIYGGAAGLTRDDAGYFGGGSPARFFYSAKADADDRLSSKHPTVKPVALMRWLVRLVTPPGGTVLDPFAGSGSTGMACMADGFSCILIEREAEYIADIRRRLAHVRGEDTPLFSR